MHHFEFDGSNTSQKVWQGHLSHCVPSLLLLTTVWRLRRNIVPILSDVAFRVLKSPGSSLLIFFYSPNVFSFWKVDTKDRPLQSFNTALCAQRFHQISSIFWYIVIHSLWNFTLKNIILKMFHNLFKQFWCSFYTQSCYWLLAN